MGAIASQITSLTIVYSTFYSDPDQSKHQSSGSLAFVWGIQWPANSRHKGSVTRKMFPFHEEIIPISWLMRVPDCYLFMSATNDASENNLTYIVSTAYACYWPMEHQSYLRQVKLTPWQLMSSILEPPRHQQPWHCIDLVFCEIICWTPATFMRSNDAKYKYKYLYFP